MGPRAAPAQGREGPQVVAREEKSSCSSAQLSMGQFVVNGDLPEK